MRATPFGAPFAWLGKADAARAFLVSDCAVACAMDFFVGLNTRPARDFPPLVAFPPRVAFPPLVAFPSLVALAESPVCGWGAPGGGSEISSDPED